MTARRSALIVATSQYKDQRLAALEGPVQDAEALRTVLAHKEIGGFDVRVALNSRVDTLRRTLEAFFADRARDDLLLVHFSGHGLKDDDGQLYLAAADTQIDRLLSTGVDAAWVNRLMAKCRSEKIALFLDCCFAGAFTTTLARRVGVDTAGVKEHFNGSGLFVITASDAMQYSFEGGRQVGQPPEPSPFTKALVDGLQSGEADRNEDGHVSINELFDFLEDRIRETSPSQTPTKSAFNQTGDWVIARSTRVPSIRLLPEDLQGHLKSEDALDRFGALIDLRNLLDGPDPRVADAALQAVQKLAEDDSRRVAAAARRMLDEEAARPRSAARAARRRATRVQAVPITPDAVPTMAEAVPVAPEAVPVMFGAVPVAPEAIPVMSEAVPVTAEPVPVTLRAASGAPAVAPSPEVASPPAQPAPAPAAPAVAPPAPEVIAPAAAAAVASSTALFVETIAPVRTPPETPALQAAASPAGGVVLGGSAGTATTLPQGAPTIAGAATARSVQPANLAWSLGRAAARAAIGSFVWVLLQFGWFLGTNSAIFDDPDALSLATNTFGEMVGLVAIGTTLAVAIAEALVPALRLPGGAAYRVVGGNRWVASAALGLITGLTLGLGIEYAYLTGKFDSMLGLGQEILFCAPLGFVLAEAAVGRWFGGNRKGQSLAA